MSSDFDILEKERRAAIVMAANLLEGVDKAKQLRKRANAVYPHPRVERTNADEKRDFLFDLFRLNANYINQLAQLGKGYNDIAHRELERLYSSVAPTPGRCAGGGGVTTELTFDFFRTPVPPYVEAAFCVSGDVSFREVTLSLEALSPPLVRPPRCWLQILNVGHWDDLSDPRKIRVAPDDLIDIKVRVNGAVFPPEISRRYTSELVVATGKSERRIPIAIDLRRPEEAEITRAQPMAKG